jgi:hypothetical protein
LPAKIPDAKLGHTATSLGILIDKMRLLRDESTVITDNRTQVVELIAVLSRKYGKTQEEVAADLIRIRPDMTQCIGPSTQPTKSMRSKTFVTRHWRSNLRLGKRGMLRPVRPLTFTGLRRDGASRGAMLNQSMRQQG